ncbi:hypothetical protein SAMN05216275_105152 [Streptosporangium canum]|uniref:Uncharacterized protein n=1 Tax=Streptosporangium canum TaxID=324952 RepID=A0A1I3LHK4_9ACTN|nr:hypothetical protein SAMN05216275_105152 [Streptosporangium canum]
MRGASGQWGESPPELAAAPPAAARTADDAGPRPETDP